MTYGDFKDLPRRAASDKYYVIRHSKLLVIHSMMDINIDLHELSTYSLIKDLETPLLT